MDENQPIATIGPQSTARPSVGAFSTGAVVGALGGLIGLGGAEFRLPLLIGVFRFAAVAGVILNKTMSLIVVATALPFRAVAVPFAASRRALVDHHQPAQAGSLIGTWVRGRVGDAAQASHTLYRVIAALLLAIAVVLLVGT